MEQDFFSSYGVPEGQLMVKQEDDMGSSPPHLSFHSQPYFDFHSGLPPLSGEVLMSDTFTSNLHTSLSNLDEEQVLSLSSPEPDIEELLFPDLRNEPPDISSHSMGTRMTQNLVFNLRQNVEKSPIEVNLCHKPRGCKGIWQPVGNRDALRVTKGKGKWLKLEIKSSFSSKPSDLDVFLLDISGTDQPKLIHTADEGFVIESTTELVEPNGKHVKDVELKLDRVCKKLQFWVTIRSPVGLLTGKSVEFGAHNNGKANNKKEVSDDSPVGDYESTSSSPDTKMSIPTMNAPERKDTLKKRKKTNGEEVTTSASREEAEVDLRTVVQGSLQVQGVVQAKAFIQFSDLRLKTDIQDLTDAVNIVSQLQGKSFKWRKGANLDEEEGGERVIGLIAQEVQKVIPNVVHEDDNGILSVAYAELVPVLIEALKENNRQYEQDKGDLSDQLNLLNAKLESIQLVVKKAEEEREALKNKPVAPQIIYPPPIVIQQMEIEEPSKDQQLRQGVYRISVLVLFFVGIAAIIFGSIYLGFTLSASPEILTTVLEAINLRGTDQDGVPDPYCQISVGKALFRTDTQYNTPNPLWEETFSSDYDKSIYSVIFQMFDQNDFSLADLRIGAAQMSVDSLDQDTRYVQWLSLDSSSASDNVTYGQLKVALYISSAKRPGFELAVLIVGFCLTLVSLFMGFYTWRSPPFRIKSS